VLAIGCDPKDDGWAFKLARGLMKSMDSKPFADDLDNCDPQI